MFGFVELSLASYVFWSPGLLWGHVLPDSLIALSSCLISIALIRIIRKRSVVPFNPPLFFFAILFVLYGVTHATDVVTYWRPDYLISGSLKACIAVISIIALVLLARFTMKRNSTSPTLADDHFQELIEEAPDAILQVDPTGVIVLVNRSAGEMFGYSREELLGSNVDMLIPNAHRAAHPKQRERFNKAGAKRRMGEKMGDLHAVRKDGTEFSVEIGLSTMRTETGVLVTAMIRDVSARKQMEQELEAERNQRNQRVEILARLAGGLAHEIKNPLAIIHARASDLAGMAEVGDVDRAQIKRACSSIVETSDRAIRILQGIAAMARMGPHDPMQPTDMIKTVEEAANLVNRRFTMNGIQLVVNFPTTIPTVLCREVQISQVLINLLDNAFDAVTGDPQSERWVRIEISALQGANHEANNEKLQIEVIDGGPGVAAENRERLMQTFFTTKELGGGFGIGLSVSRTIAEDHGGQLELCESDGHTCFRLTLPMLAEKRQEVAA